MDTGKLLVVFIIGSFATIAGTLVACKLFPLKALGADGWKVRGAARDVSMHGAALCSVCLRAISMQAISVRICKYRQQYGILYIAQVASALAARHIGGAVNYVAGVRAQPACRLTTHLQLQQLVQQDVH